MYSLTNPTNKQIDSQHKSNHPIQCYANEQIHDQMLPYIQLWAPIKLPSATHCVHYPTPKPMQYTYEKAREFVLDQSSSSWRRRSSSSTSIRLMRFLVNSNAVKKIALTTHERDMETPRPKNGLVEREGVEGS